MTVQTSLLDVLRDYVGTITGHSIIESAVSRSGIDPETATTEQFDAFVAALQPGIKAFVPDHAAQAACIERLHGALDGVRDDSAGSASQLHVDILSEYDIATVRSHARAMCAEVGFGISEQVKLTTVVSELARNIVQYAGKGRIELEDIDTPHRGIEIRAMDDGPGILDIESVLDGSYHSKTGLGLGLLGTSKLVDEFEVDSAPGRGTRVIARKYLS